MNGHAAVPARYTQLPSLTGFHHSRVGCLGPFPQARRRSGWAGWQRGTVLEPWERPTTRLLAASHGPGSGGFNPARNRKYGIDLPSTPSQPSQTPGNPRPGEPPQLRLKESLRELRGHAAQLTEAYVGCLRLLRDVGSELKTELKKAREEFQAQARDAPGYFRDTLGLLRFLQYPKMAPIVRRTLAVLAVVFLFLAVVYTCDTVFAGLPLSREVLRTRLRPS